MGLTGLGLALFVLAHMLGNLLIFAGPKSYNLYAHQLETFPLLVVFELGLLSLFVIHIILALILTIKNLISRYPKTKISPSGQKKTAWYKKGLITQGAVILVFVILHLITFKYGEYYKVTYSGKTVRDIFRLVVDAFHNPVRVIWYLFALLILSIHLFHGLKSSFQSLGLNHPKFNMWIHRVSIVYAVVVTTGYISLPLYVFLTGGYR